MLWLSHRRITVFLAVVIGSLILLPISISAQQETTENDDTSGTPHPHADSCSWTGGACEWDYNMQMMTATFLNDKKETFYAYVEPDVSTFYNQSEGQLQPVQPDFTGMFVKFVNMGPKMVRVLWIPNGNTAKDPLEICDIEPFGSCGTASYPSQHFQLAWPDNLDLVLERFTTKPGKNVYVYDAFRGSYEKAYRKLKPEDFQHYMMQYNNNLFNKHYKEKTGREWLALYGQKFPPRFHMWQADSLGQTHVVTTKEIHFVEYPPEEELAKGVSLYGPRPEEITRNRKHRDTHATMELHLTVLSCAPRVFEIKHFLSDLEVDHLLKVAEQKNLETSTTRAGDYAKVTQEESTRTSTNTWIGRHQDIILDAIYRRAADVMKIDERLFRRRRKTEIPEFTESMVDISESLQLVHYDVGQQYTPHHDFAMPRLVKGQPSRFATLLLYLNDEGLRGGETTFPMWRNAETSKRLDVKPEKGKALLFYNLLPDGNYDELSMHAARPVLQGEKWLANLWVWDPVLAHG
ncbi:Probable prolyl 4-hydroxylase [Seminavis robusta]|uniref:Probable prolyl 4-hydroxylase n=1 Tax=Seminavis robusta TaxID=568900 RepID=A0A9N8HC07_9STRA|nr:Probable prolyl 4-hydroxylase [Seminavis robusta]|eukprot:Sro359_g126020.1 Probable prolyl 4-hydroxylase (519) ;mRNA; f:10578-12438